MENVIQLHPASQGLLEAILGVPTGPLSPAEYLRAASELPLRDRDLMLLPEGITDTDLAITWAAMCLASAKRVKRTHRSAGEVGRGLEGMRRGPELRLIRAHVQD
jgi:hypothetical protein